jgi:hypothetical protein
MRYFFSKPKRPFMRRVTQLAYLPLFVFIAFTSCQKSESEKDPETVREKSILSSAENRANISKSLKGYFDQKPSAGASASEKGSKFITPFSVGEGQGIFEFNPETPDYRMVNFLAYLDDKDFYRENPDGTVSVHVNSTSTLAEYSEGNFMEMEPSKYLYGENGHLNVNYTGTVVEFPIYDWETGELLFVFKFVSPDNSIATVFNCNGRVGENDGAPWQMLTKKMLTTSTGLNIYQYNLGDIMFKNKFTF